MMNKKVAIIIGIILLAAAVTYVANAAGLVFTGGSGSNAMSSSIQKGLVGYWPLDGDNYNATTGRVTDKTPYENHGTNYGATLTTDRNGQSNGAMSFDGSSGYIRLPNLGSFQSFTIAGWIKGVGDSLSGGTGYNTFVGKQNNNRLLYNMGGIMLAQMGAGNHFSSIQAPRGQWNFVVYVYNQTNTTAKWYINGNPDTELVGAISFSQPYGIGAYDATNYMMNGSIADVRIYNRALSADEVSALYNSNKPKVVSDSLQKGLVLDMPLTSNYTKTVTAGSQIMTDKTPYSNNEQNYGATVGADSTSFNGSTNFVSGSTVNTGNNFSVFAWVKPITATHGRNNVVTNGYPYGTDKGWFFSFQLNNSFFLSIGHDDAYAGSQPGIITNGAWNFIGGTVTNGGASFQLYLNGEPVSNASELSSSRNVLYTDPTLYIGRRTSEYFNGSISGVKIYNRALSATEIKSLYDKGRQ